MNHAEYGPSSDEAPHEAPHDDAPHDRAPHDDTLHDHARHDTADPDVLCTQLRRIPRVAGDYEFGAEEALTRFGLGESELAALRRAGLHGRSADGEFTYAGYDLHYVGLRLGLAQDVLAGVRLWRTSLERLTEAGGMRVRVTYVPKLPGESGPVEGRVVLPGRPGERVELHHLAPAAEFTAELSADWPALPDEVAAAVAEVARNEFCRLPERHFGDTELARRIGLTECWTGARLVVEGCRRLGRRARTAHGLMITLPFSSMHSWAEVEVDGVWTPVDPLIVDVMRRWGGLDPAAWPVHRSPGAMLVPLVWDPPAPYPLVSRDGRDVPATFLTRVADQPAASGAAAAAGPPAP